MVPWARAPLAAREEALAPEEVTRFVLADPITRAIGGFTAGGGCRCSWPTLASKSLTRSWGLAVSGRASLFLLVLGQRSCQSRALRGRVWTGGTKREDEIPAKGLDWRV